MPWPARSNQQFDYLLNGKGYMLVRGQPPNQGRSWDRRGTADIPYRFYQWHAGEFDPDPDEIDFAEVFKDWSGGAGAAYRRGPQSDGDPDNRYLFAQNFDARWPRQLIHAQNPALLPAAQYSGSNVNVEYLTDVPLPGVPNPPAGAGAILAYGQNFLSTFAPTPYLTMASAFILKPEATGQAFIGRPASFGSFTYIAVGPNNGHYQRKFDGTVGTLNTLMQAQGFANAGNRMWRRFGGYLVNSVSIGADPNATANWSATLAVGNGLNNINDMAERGDAIFLGMDDGLFQGDTGGSFFNILAEARDARHNDNGRDLTVYDGGMAYAGAPGVFWYQPAQFGGARGDSIEIGPQGATSGRTPVRGRNRAAKGFGPWLYVGMWTGSQSWVKAGRRNDQRVAADPYVWHDLQLLPHTAKIHRIHFDGITNASGQFTEIPTRMWIATDASYGAQAGATAPLYFMPIPRLNQNPLIDTAFTPNYCGSARIDMPLTDRQMPGVLKVFRAVEVWADNLLSGSRYADVWVTIDNGVRQYAGRAVNSPKSTLVLPGDRGTFLSGQAIQLSVESYIATQSYLTPVYRSFVIRGSVSPRSIDVVTAVTWISDNLVDRWGAPMRDGATMITELRQLSDPLLGGGLPVQMVDLSGATQWVKLLPSIHEQEIHQAGEKPPEVAATVRFAVLDFTSSVGPPIVAELPLFAQGDGFPM